MSVSSVNPYLAALYAQYYTSGVGNATVQSGQSSSSGLKGISGVDSFEFSSPMTLTGYTAEMAGAGKAQFGPPPPPPGTSANSSGSSTDDPIKSFLDKVAAGTVTDEDLASMQTTLANLSASANSSGSSTDDPIKSFLDKVAAGTVTDEDLTNMQTLLKQWQQAAAK